jgi:hypothetical protein
MGVVKPTVGVAPWPKMGWFVTPGPKKKKKKKRFWAIGGGRTQPYISRTTPLGMGWFDHPQTDRGATPDFLPLFIYLI